ncbi:SixA phosphatase family protein [Hyunsoonleella sp. 2307UL5-6]|uniref:SixA phosphatase family protein n=1 Tax=Hyunsoonleella sp. 2307UL5-6 TaxID=3384768 RepID=UPI0039BD2C21
MKTIIVVRHAKSSWEYDVIDHQRPLKQRGINDANLIANKLATLNLDIDSVIISDATRTKLTADIILPKLKVKEHIVSFSHKLYDFSGNNLLEVIKTCKSSIDTLMIFGHNHAITTFVNTFGDTYIDNVPTCGVVIIEFNINKWSALSPGTTLKTIYPKNLRD